MDNEFIENIIVGANDVDEFKQMKYSSIFTAIEHASSDHVDTIGQGGKDLLARGLVWVVARANVVMKRLPLVNEKLTIKTWPGNNMKFIYPRYTLILDEKGNEIGKANVLWSIIDLKNRRIVMNPSKLVNYFKVENKVEKLIEDPIGLKFNELKNHKLIKVCDSDIDLNGHVNNAKYLDWIYNVIEKDYLKNHFTKNVIINYQHEIGLEDNVDLSYEINDGNLCVSGMVNNIICFNALIKF